MPGPIASKTYGTVSAEGRLTDGNGRLLAHGTTTCPIIES